MDTSAILSTRYRSHSINWFVIMFKFQTWLDLVGLASPCRCCTAIPPKLVVLIHAMKRDEGSHGLGTIRRLAEAKTMVVR